MSDQVVQTVDNATDVVVDELQEIVQEVNDVKNEVEDVVDDIKKKGCPIKKLVTKFKDLSCLLIKKFKKIFEKKKAQE